MEYYMYKILLIVSCFFALNSHSAAGQVLKVTIGDTGRSVTIRVPPNTSVRDLKHIAVKAALRQIMQNNQFTGVNKELNQVAKLLMDLTRKNVDSQKNYTSQVVLIHKGKLLENNKKVSDYKIMNNAWIDSQRGVDNTMSGIFENAKAFIRGFISSQKNK